MPSCSARNHPKNLARNTIPLEDSTESWKVRLAVTTQQSGKMKDFCEDREPSSSISL